MGSGGNVASFAGALASAKPLTKTVRVCLDGELVAEVERVAEQYRRAREEDERTNEPDRAPALAERIQELQEQVKAREVEFTFRSIGRLAWRDLVAQHPPTKKQREDFGADFNTETFPVAAMAASCVSPEGADLEGFERLAELVTDGQWNRLWLTCHAANLGAGEVPNLSAAFGLPRPTETNSE